MVPETRPGALVIEAAPSRSGVRAHRKLMNIMVNGCYLIPLIAVWRELPWWTTMATAIIGVGNIGGALARASRGPIISTGASGFVVEFRFCAPSAMSPAFPESMDHGHRNPAPSGPPVSAKIGPASKGRC